MEGSPLSKTINLAEHARTGRLEEVRTLCERLGIPGAQKSTGTC